MCLLLPQVIYVLCIEFCIGVSSCVCLPILVFVYPPSVSSCLPYISLNLVYASCALSATGSSFTIFFGILSMLIHTYNLSIPLQSTYPNLAVYCLHLDLSPNACVSNSLSPHSSHYFLCEFHLNCI